MARASIACRRSTGKVGTDAAFGGASRPCAEPTPVSARGCREGERAVQREDVTLADGQVDVARRGTDAFGQAVSLDVYHHLGGLVVEGEGGSLGEAHGLGFTAKQVSRLIVRVAALVALHAPSRAFHGCGGADALHGDGTWFCPIVFAGQVAFIIHRVVVPLRAVPVGYLQGYRLIAVPPVVHGGAGVGTALYGGGQRQRLRAVGQRSLIVPRAGGGRKEQGECRECMYGISFHIVLFLLLLQHRQTVGAGLPLVGVVGKGFIHAINSGLPSGCTFHFRGFARTFRSIIANAIANLLTAPVAGGDVSIIRNEIRITPSYAAYSASGYRTAEPAGGDGAQIGRCDTPDVTIISRILQCPRYGAGDDGAAVTMGYSAHCRNAVVGHIFQL